MRKKLIIAAGAVLAIIILIYGNIQPGSGKQSELQRDQLATEHSQSNASTDSGSGAPDPENPIRATDLKGLVAGGCIDVVVKRVVDGDTIWVEHQGEEYKVRLLCIDTPESVKENVKEQPFGRKAAEKLEEMILGKEVQLLFEIDIRDNYDRLLAYVLLEDGTCVNATMVSEGFARVNAVKPNTIHRDYFIELQKNAIDEGKGLWSLPEDKRPFVKKDDNYYIPRYYEDESA